VIVGRFTNGANVSIEGEMGVKSDAKNFGFTKMNIFELFTNDSNESSLVEWGTI